MNHNSQSPDYLVSKSTSTGTPSPPLQTSQSSTSLINHCERHSDSSNYYCQTCSLSICGECDLRNHNGHVTVHLMEAMDHAGMQANQVLGEAMHGIKTITEDLEAISVSFFFMYAIKLKMRNPFFKFLLVQLFILIYLYKQGNFLLLYSWLLVH